MGSSGQRVWGFRVLSVLIGLLGALLFAELALRVVSAITEKDPAAQLARVGRSEPPPVITDCRNQRPQARLGEMIRLTSERDVIYRLRPNMDTCFVGARVRTNGDGLRAPRDYERPKPEGVYRVLFLGDSQAFGWGVSQERSFIALLESRLGAMDYDRTVEVVNAATPAYNTAQEAADYASRGITYDPDCVLILYIPNDFDAPFFLLERRNPLALDHWFLADLLRDGLSAGRAMVDAPNLQQVSGSPLVFLPDERSADRVPRRYRHMIGEQAYRDALRLIREKTPAAVPVVNFAAYDPAIAEPLIAYQESLGIVHPDFSYPWRPEWLLGSRDQHLNEAGHVELAQRIVDGLHQRDVCMP